MEADGSVEKGIYLVAIANPGKRIGNHSASKINSVYPHTPSSARYASDGPTSVAPTSAPSEVSPGHAEELHQVDFDSDQTVTDSTKVS